MALRRLAPALIPAEGPLMLSIHPNARTTPAVRAEIARSQESSGGHCHGNVSRDMAGAGLAGGQAAVAAFQLVAASALNRRRVEREMRWR